MNRKMEEGVDKYRTVAPNWKEVIKAIQSLNESKPALMLKGIASISIIKCFPFSQLKNMLAYCIVADMIDGRTPYLFHLPLSVSSCAAGAGKLKSTFPTCCCGYVSGCDSGSAIQTLSCEAWMWKTGQVYMS